MTKSMSDKTNYQPPNHPNEFYIKTDTSSRIIPEPNWGGSKSRAATAEQSWVMANAGVPTAGSVRVSLSPTGELGSPRHPFMYPTTHLYNSNDGKDNNNNSFNTTKRWAETIKRELERRRKRRGSLHSWGREVKRRGWGGSESAIEIWRRRRPWESGGG